LELSVRISSLLPTLGEAIRTRLESSRRAFWSGVEAAAVPVASLFMTAGLVRTLDRQDYGLLVVVLAVSALSMAMNLAVAATTTKCVSEAVGSGSADDRRVARLLTASLMAVASLGLICLVGCWMFAGTLSHMLFGDEVVRDRHDVSTVLLLAVLAVCIQQIDGVFGAAIKGLERFREQALFELCSRFGVTAAAITAGWLTHDIHSVLAANCAASALSAGVRCFAFRMIAPGAHVFARPNRRDIQGVAGFGSWMWLSVTASVAYATLDRVMVARILGPAAAAEFQVYIQLSMLVQYIPASLLAFSFPVLSRLSASRSEGGRETISRIYRKLLTASIIGGFLISTVLAVFRRDLIRLIAGSGFQVSDDTTFLYLVYGFALLSVSIAPYYLLLGLGRSKNVSLVTTTSVAVAVALMPFLISRYGLEGAAIGRFVFPIGSLLLLCQVRGALRDNERAGASLVSPG
jgi:O-antigen/teichoic acid export membrane protein